ncbi:GDP-Man:Man(3)GlcNAc(2)-PP-Dol alpha-1,2-mannosyltransferase [Choanephora cucurbitarum]|uniref:GDP-Man:Man(3)GlcNAc(2)-PP-Dol alpha-1,2-mannosyltransferase n=1 Tax=Choanephora cucurbitarum TaxID=101091 RepID=A0A1C7NI82_9FUNG|nr:GDP-Man:Man(3)GlcNAc(2)-PP-Dol alpha-1,2-mannosyltransferase [Choanephora cucurbitarum]
MILFLCLFLAVFTAIVWLSISFFKLKIKSLAEETRVQLLHELGPDTSQIENPVFLGFFHPYCNAGGGGERVLWTAIRDIQKEFPQAICAIYTGDLDATKQQIINKVKNSFNIEMNPNRLAFIYLKKRYLVEDSRYPRFTLILQSLASIVVGYEAISKLVPDIFFDTMGYAFTYPLVHYFTNAKIATYTHYPIISSDMVNRVYERREAHNNDAKLASNPVWSTGKLIYYRLFAKIYGFCGSFAQTVIVNSTWTKGHIDQLWHTKAAIVYPPCDTERMSQLPLHGRKPMIVSVAQFRPEKDHSLQLKSLARLFATYPEWKPRGVELVLIGSCRNDGDAQRIDKLRQEANELKIQDHVRFEINAPYDLLVSTLGMAKIGIHTMWNEHFGIGVVEYMAAGLIPVAHKSGGPKLDIVTEYDGRPTGYLADSEDSFAHCLHTALSLSQDEYEQMASNARVSASDKFSEEAFSSDLLCSLRSFLT